ncbi:carboxymethylenebutenolidase [Oscillatoriales cyanobacterium USR001]|nr:carboxymethylenebutenolidase [Oscillatoriales cyanobacterium USR001]
MSELKINTANVTVTNGELEIAAYVALPAIEQGKFPGVIVIQEIFGVNSHIREVTERIAKEGYIAIAPAIYQRQAPDLQLGYTPEDIKIGRQYKEQTTAAELLSDIQATINYLKTLPSLKTTTGFGCIGFCFGGHVAYLAATLPDIIATASFYGAGIATMTPGGGDPTIARTADIKGTLYGFFGTQDASIPPEQVEQIETELQKHNIPHQIFRYEADHGFFCDHRSNYNATAAAAAWIEVKQLFEQKLST